MVENVAAEIVGKMGGRATTSAQLSAARMLAFRIMRENDHRYSHIERDMPHILHLVQSPTKSERDFNLLNQTNLVERYNNSKVSNRVLFWLGASRHRD